MNQVAHLFPRIKAAGIHLLLSALIIGCTAIVVFSYWYPWPYSVISGGRKLFILVLSVDLVLGPLLTFVVFNTKKTRGHLIRDLSIIGLMQLAGLGYGLHTAFKARPVAMVFEVNQFRVVSDNDVLHEELGESLPEFKTLSLTGPRVIGARRPVTGDERLQAIDFALKGYDVGTRPSYWRPYNELIPMVLKQARPVSDLYTHYPKHQKEIDRVIGDAGRNANELSFLPIMGRESNWSVLLDAKTGDLVSFMPLDGFF